MGEPVGAGWGMLYPPIMSRRVCGEVGQGNRNRAYAEIGGGYTEPGGSKLKRG